ncbi:MAG: glycogen/starch synthase [Armatimonadota bacterium]
MLIFDAEIPRTRKSFSRALARGMLAAGHDVRVAVPAWDFLPDDAHASVRPVLDLVPVVSGPDSIRSLNVLTCLVEGVFHYLIDCGCECVYSGNGLDEDECVLFVRGIMTGLGRIRPQWTPELVHINDSSPGMAATCIHAICMAEWDLCNLFVTTVHSGPLSRRANTLLTATGLGDEVRIVRCYRSPEKLAAIYGEVYEEVMAGASRSQSIAA